MTDGVASEYWPLSPIGEARTHHMLPFLARYRPDCLVSSTQPKSTQTADIIGAAFGLNTVVQEGLHDFERPAIPVKTTEYFSGIIRPILENPDDLIFGYETANQALCRFERSLQTVLDTLQDKRVIALVSHGSMIAMFSALYNSVDPIAIWGRLTCPSCVVLRRPDFRLLELWMDVFGYDGYRPADNLRDVDA